MPRAPVAVPAPVSRSGDHRVSARRRTKLSRRQGSAAAKNGRRTRLDRVAGTSLCRRTLINGTCQTCHTCSAHRHLIRLSPPRRAADCTAASRCTAAQESQLQRPDDTSPDVMGSAAQQVCCLWTVRECTANQPVSITPTGDSTRPVMSYWPAVRRGGRSGAGTRATTILETPTPIHCQRLSHDVCTYVHTTP